MSRNMAPENEGLWKRFHVFMLETDIRVLTFLPPLVGLGCMILFALLITKITGEKLAPPMNYIAGAILSFISSLGGVAEIIKQEMPGPLGRIIKGKMALISGIVLVIMFGGSGISLLILALINRR